MRTASRLVAALAVVPLGLGALVAQPETAPPPHLALDEFVREYKRLGLPLPPPNAELVRLKWSPDSLTDLGFRIPPADPSGEEQFLIGVTTYRHYPPGEPVRTAADALRGVEPRWVADLLCTAAQCRARGQNDIAVALYARGLEKTANPVPPVMVRGGVNQFGSYQVRANGWELHAENDPARSAQLELRHVAFAYWQGRIMAPGIDRREVLRYLKATDLGFHTDVRDLELTVAPRKSKPGTAEALIDDLTEWRTWDNHVHMEPGSDELHPGEAAYWKLAEMGFDAVPALLDHLNDSRFTRHLAGIDEYFTGFHRHLDKTMHVGQLTRYLVWGFAGEWLMGDYPDERVERARGWWEKARKVGEEKWLVARAFPEPRKGDLSFWPSPQPNRVVFRALGAKYPARLAEVYRAFLRTRPAPDGWDRELEGRVLAREVAASRLPRAEKLTLLEEGATHKVAEHRLAALAALAEVDPAVFRKHLAEALRGLPPDIEGTRYRWCTEGTFVVLVEKADDPACWDALAAAARRASVGLRLELLRRMAPPEPGERADPPRRERVRFLVGFLADQSARGPTPPPGKEYSVEDAGRGSATLQVRDFAALVLAEELGLHVAWDPERGGLSRLIVRESVRQLAARELAAKK